MRHKMTRREQRRIERLRRIRNITIVLAIAAMLFFLFRTDFFAIREIRVVGNDRVSEVDIVRESGLQFGTNILRASLKKATAKIEAMPYIKTASIVRASFHTLRIEVTERTADFSVLSDGTVFICDEEGRVLRTDHASTVFPVVKGFTLKDPSLGMDVFAQEGIEGLRDILQEMRVEGVQGEYLEIRFQQNHDFGLLRKENVKIEFGKAENIAYKINLIEKTLQDMEKNGKKVALIKLNVDIPVVVPEVR